MTPPTLRRPLTVDDILALDPFEPIDKHYVQPENRGSVFHAEGRILTKLARFLERTQNLLTGAIHILEIGSAVGISSRYLLDGLQSRASTLTSIDIFHRWISSYPNHYQLSGYSGDFMPFERGKYTLAFVDGDHRFEGAMADTLACIAADVPVIVSHDTNRDSIPETKGTTEGSDGAQVNDDIISKGLAPGYTHIRLPTHCGLDILTKIPL
jgi:hypothetical protein